MIGDSNSLQKFLLNKSSRIHRYFEGMRKEKEFDFNKKRKGNFVLFILWMKKLARER
jgi:hypothetical protein